ncbi:MAG: MarR family transcriptional regulator, partial [Streptosporangiales bacterium]|nr:MarR family transcriptional regulator [Streptosporangiales bacterium]
MSADPQELQQAVARFVRAFGLHQPDQTPCGQPIPTSEA